MLGKKEIYCNVCGHYVCKTSPKIVRGGPVKCRNCKSRSQVIGEVSEIERPEGFKRMIVYKTSTSGVVDNDVDTILFKR